MPRTNKVNKTFSLDRSLVEQLKRVRGAGSESEKVNSLLKFALECERRAALDREAAHFFSNAPDDREERRAYEEAALASWTRE